MGKIIFIIIIVVLVGWLISKRNEFHGMREKIKAQGSKISVWEENRAAALNDALSIAKLACGHEVSGIERLTAGDQLMQLQFLGEKYPHLNSVSGYMEALSRSFKLNEDITAAREMLTGNIQEYNIAIGEFPGLLVARMFGFKKEELIDEENLAGHRKLSKRGVDFSQF